MPGTVKLQGLFVHGQRLYLVESAVALEAGPSYCSEGVYRRPLAENKPDSFTLQRLYSYTEFSRFLCCLHAMNSRRKNIQASIGELQKFVPCDYFWRSYGVRRIIRKIFQDAPVRHHPGISARPHGSGSLLGRLFVLALVLCRHD